MSSPKMNRFEHLRRQVQSRVERLQTLPDLSTIEIRALYHELQTHQAELELQNEQLQHSHVLLEQSIQKYRGVIRVNSHRICDHRFQGACH